MDDMPRGNKIQRRVLLAIALGSPVGVGAWWLHTQISGRAAPEQHEQRSQRAASPFEVAEAIYDGGLQRGWDDRSWSKRELVEGVPARVSFDSFGGLALHHELLPASFGAVVFRFKAPPAFGEFLSLALIADRQTTERSFPRVAVAGDYLFELADGWKEARVPLVALDPEGKPFLGLTLQARRMVPSDPVLLDKLVLSRGPGGAPTSAAIKTHRSFVTLDCREDAKAISPLIYGIAVGVVSSGETAHRIGGNAMTRLNWDLGNTWNTGNDWFFENVKSDDGGLASWLSGTRASGLQMALTVPTIGWVAKDAVSSGFPRSKLARQRKYDEHRPEAGDGFSEEGKALQPLPPTQTSEPAPPERIQRWVEQLRQRDQLSGGRSVQLYMLDNEPDLWHVTHRDVHPDPLTYDELLDRTLRYGAAVRKADPEAVIAGPASWGWTGYFFSAKDTVAGAMLQPDRRAHGGQPLLAWYLQQLAEHERATGERILDVLDVHYYPQADQVYSAKADPETAARRVRSTRSLWDPTYADESWINEPVRLLPRLKEWVDRNYPGRKLALGEWSFGGEQDISGGLATAEALGRFGQHGLYAAFYWNKPEQGSATYWAFRAFRNYDGKGGRFLDFSVKAASAKQVSVFASRDQTSSHLVLVLLNLDPSYSAELDFELSSCGELELGRSFSYTGGKDGIVGDTGPAKSLSGLTLAPYSINIVELSARR